MIIRKMRSYFIYNVPITQHMLSLDEAHTFGATTELIYTIGQKFNVQKAAVPPFYTHHYKLDHTPYFVYDPAVPMQTTIPCAKLNSIGFYEQLDLTQDLKVRWDFMLSLQTTGLITICVEMTEPKNSSHAYRLSGLHLNPEHKVIDTEPLQMLWSHKADERPEFVTLDQLAQAIHEHFFQACGIPVRRFRALRHELQIPFTAVEVESSCKTQEEFINKHKRELAELVFKPACWEVERVSALHAEHILEEDRVWSVAQDTYVVTAYEGAVYVKIKNFDTGIPHKHSGFYVADEESVLFSFKVAVSNYHLLRILDDLMDKEMSLLKKDVNRYQTMLHATFAEADLKDNKAVLREMNDFVIQVTNLEYDLIELMEELDNPDKLIDEEWHIVLLDKLNNAFGVRAWHDGLKRRVNNLRELVQTVESTYQRLLDLTMSQSIFNLQFESKIAEEREKFVGLIFGAFAIAELLGLFIVLAFDDQHPMVLRLIKWFDLSIAVSHILSSLIIALLIVIVLIPVLRYLNREV
ncbi:MAG: hypothetical protein KDE51_15175 [Anaerolineales bacterium]|nr:hypothetical protein [Anaerolineales bacterium]